MSEPVVRVTLTEIYRLLLGIDRKVEALATSDHQMDVRIAEHDGAIKAHAEALGRHSDRLSTTEAHVAALQADRAPKTSSVAVIAGVTACIALLWRVVALPQITALIGGADRRLLGAGGHADHHPDTEPRRVRRWNLRRVHGNVSGLRILPGRIVTA